MRDTVSAVVPMRLKKSPVRRVRTDSSQPLPSTPEGLWLTMSGCFRLALLPGPLVSFPIYSARVGLGYSLRPETLAMASKSRSLW